jgi:5-formyltetrahydrofolate cyclo-ligase
MSKKLLREKLLKQRQSLSREIWREQSDRVCQHLQNSLEFDRAATVLVYQSIRQEVDLGYLFTHTDRRWGLARCQDKSLLWHCWQPPEDLIPGAYGILEPPETAPLVEPNTVDLILIPAVAMDRSGYRLGYGGGYYDRMLADPIWAGVNKIGVVFDFAYLDRVPVEDWDLPLDAICTEEGMITVT